MELAHDVLLGPFAEPPVQHVVIGQREQCRGGATRVAGLAKPFNVAPQRAEGAGLGHAKPGG